MSIVTVNPYNEEHYRLMKKSDDRQIFESLLKRTKYMSESEWKYKNQKSNWIEEYVILEKNNHIENYCVFTGTKDNRIVQMDIKKVVDKPFLEKATKYGFDKLDAHIITIFSDKENNKLKEYGFECLGEYKNKIIYIKEKGMEKIERVK